MKYICSATNSSHSCSYLRDVHRQKAYHFLSKDQNVISYTWTISEVTSTVSELSSGRNFSQYPSLLGVYNEAEQRSVSAKSARTRYSSDPETRSQKIRQPIITRPTSLYPIYLQGNTNAAPTSKFLYRFTT